MEFSIKNIEEQIIVSRKIAVLTFITGSLILLLYYFTRYHGVIYLSLLFLVCAVFVNTFFSYLLLYGLYKKRNYKKPILISLFLMILNIPVGIVYMNIGFTIYNLITSNNV